MIKDPSNIRDYFKRWPKFYYFVLVVFSPVYWSGLSQKGFLKKYIRSGEVLNLGSGPQVLPGITNVDMFAYKGVDVVADILKLPFADNSVQGVISNTVLEHVRDPRLAVQEMYRVLAHGGYAYVTVPFLYPFHASPDDYTRWTHVGVAELFKDFEIVEKGVRAGPFSALTTGLCYICAMIFCFGSEFVYWVLVNLFMFLFFPLKLLDIVASKLPFALHLSSIIYVVLRKK